MADFQDLALWRRLTVLVARCFGLLGWTVIIPMAFSNEGYLREIRSGLERTGKRVIHFCLTAPLEVIQLRLAGRGHDAGEWVERRAAECCIAHESEAFARQVATPGRTVGEIAAELAGHLN